MLRILAVEDEIFFRKSLINTIETSNSGFMVVAEAGNGKQALEIFEKTEIDVILTDIAMPVIDGIEFIKKVREKDKKVKIIILSCLNDFSYAKRAMKYGVDDYFLKVETDPAELIVKLKALEIQIQNERLSEQKLDAICKSFDQNRDEIQEKFLKMLVWGPAMSESEVLGKISQLELHLNKKNLFLAYLEFDGYESIKENNSEKDLELLNFSAKNILREVMKSGICSCMFQKNIGQYVVFVSFPNDENSFVMRSVLLEKLNFISSQMEQLFSITLTAGVSLLQQCFDTMVSAYEQAYKAFKQKFFSGKNKIYFNEDMPLILEGRSNMNIMKKEYLLAALESHNLSGLKNEIMAKLKEMKLGNQPESSFRNTAIEIILVLSRKINEQVIDTTGAYELPMDVLNSVHNIDTLEELQEWLFQNVDAFYANYIYAKGSAVSVNIIDKIKEYVIHNYFNNINLNVVANSFNITPCYASIIFKAKTGVNFIDYLADIRIKNARQLLKGTNTPIQEVACKVGYPNSQYFCKVFKKYTGVSPTVYRTDNASVAEG